MQIKIISAGIDSYWYSKHIGEIFEAEPRHITPTWILDYRVLSTGSFVEFEDCEVLSNA